MATLEQVNVWVGLDVGKEEHFAAGLDDTGEQIFARAVANDQAVLDAVLDRAAEHGTPGLVIDQPCSIAQLALAGLKNAMFLAAFASLRSPDSKAFYDRKRAEDKPHNAAIICLARRRCNVIVAMLNTRTPYAPRQSTPELADAA